MGSNTTHGSWENASAFVDLEEFWRRSRRGFFFFKDLFIYAYGCFVWMQICTPEEGIKSHWATVMDGCEQMCGLGFEFRSSGRAASVLLTIEPSLRAWNYNTVDESASRRFLNYSSVDPILQMRSVLTCGLAEGRSRFAQVPILVFISHKRKLSCLVKFLQNLFPQHLTAHSSPHSPSPTQSFIHFDFSTLLHLNLDIGSPFKTMGNLPHPRPTRQRYWPHAFWS